MPASAVEMVRIGEETGDLSGMPARAAQEMREAADQSLERFLALFQPALIVGVGLVVGVNEGGRGAGAHAAVSRDRRPDPASGTRRKHYTSSPRSSVGHLASG